jgi:hypothetical protein
VVVMLQLLKLWASLKTKKTDIIIMGTLTQHIRLIRKLRRQPWADCQKIETTLTDLLFKDLDIDLVAVW